MDMSLQEEQSSMAWDPHEHVDNVRVHAILLLLGWGFFIPVATFTSSHLNRRTWKLKGFGAHLHLALGMIGLILALAGFAFGVKKFSTLGSDARDNVPTYNKAHAILGCVATEGGILQLLLFPLIHKPKDKEDLENWKVWTWWNQIAFWSHRALVVLSVLRPGDGNAYCKC